MDKIIYPHFPMIHKFPLPGVLFATDANIRSTLSSNSWKSRTASEYYLALSANGEAGANISAASVVSAGSSAIYTEQTRQLTKATGHPGGRRIAKRNLAKFFSPIVVPPLYVAATQRIKDG